MKSCAVLALAGTACLLWRRASAATRHLIWCLAVASLPLLPLSSALAPHWQKPLWSVSTSRDSGNQVSLAVEIAPASGPLVSTGEPATVANQVEVPSSAPAGTRHRQIAAQLNANWLLVTFTVWCGGMVWILISVGIGRIWLGMLRRKAERLHDAGWQRLLDEARKALGLRRPVELLQSADDIMPLTWGWRKPVILLPAQAAQWCPERRRVVLLHELAHVKRHDYFTHFFTRMVCALYWFNPLVWVAVRRMCVERERAADDLVLNGGCKASDYAGHLVDIARNFRRVPQLAGIAMARASGLERRVTAIVDASRIRHVRPITVWAFAILSGALLLCIGGWSAESNRAAARADSPLLRQQINQLKTFSAAKEKQSKTLAEADGEQIGPDYQRLFDAAKRGDVSAVTNLYEDFKKRHGQYANSTNRGRILPHTAFWSPVLETCLAYDHIANCSPKYTQIAVDGIINSIPRGSIYFGGTDPGRGLPTAFSKSQTDADPFYTLTQNALADGTYLDYLRKTYGEESKLLNSVIKARQADSALKDLDTQVNQAWERLNSVSVDTNNALKGPEILAAEAETDRLKQQADERSKAVWAAVKEQAGKAAGTTLYIPTSEDQQNCFAEYTADAARRFEHDKNLPGEPLQMKPGENIRVEEGRVQVSGQVAVMSINALMCKIIFDKNPGREFYVEESFPLEWMFPRLEPHGLIMKINREPVSTLPDEVILKDHEYWQGLANQMIGDWLKDDTSVQTIADFVERTYVRKDLSGFKGDPEFVRDRYAPKMFSKWRGGIGGIYAWRIGLLTGVATPSNSLPGSDAERQRMAREADFAFRQAFAMCPYSPEVFYRYVHFLVGQGRTSDALVIAEAASDADSANESIRQLRDQLRKAPGSSSANLQTPTQKGSLLEFRRVHPDSDDLTNRDIVAPGYERMTIVKTNQANGSTRIELLIVERSVLMDQSAVQSATIGKDMLGHPEIEIKLTESGREQFAQITRQNLGRRLAIVIDGRLVSAPRIQSEISDGSAVITGDFTPEEAQRLAESLNAARSQAPPSTSPVPDSSAVQSDKTAPGRPGRISSGARIPDIDDLAENLRTNIIAQSDWSERVRSGAHVLRARMLLAHMHVSPYSATGLYLDLQNVSDVSTPMQIYFDPVNSVHFEFLDADGKPAPRPGGGGSIFSRTNQTWVTLPYGSTIRLQVNLPTKVWMMSDDRETDTLSVILPSNSFGSASSFGINAGDTNAYYLSGTFAIHSPTNGVVKEERSPDSIWTGTLQFPKMKVHLNKQ